MHTHKHTRTQLNVASSWCCNISYCICLYVDWLTANLFRLKAHFQDNPKDLGNKVHRLDSSVDFFVQMRFHVKIEGYDVELLFGQIFWNMTRSWARRPPLRIYVTYPSTYWTQPRRKQARLSSWLEPPWEIPTLLAARVSRGNSEKTKTPSNHSILRYIATFYS